MRLLRHLSDLPDALRERDSVVTIGAYDGLHRGHRQLLDRVIDIGAREELQTVLMSFEPTPKEFFQADRPPARLMRFGEKFRALDGEGVDVFYCPRFSEAMHDISAADFIRRILVHGLNARRVVVGDDFRFARRREGNLDTLLRAGRALGYTVEQVPSVMVGDIRVSSTAIREACAAGDMETVTALLGRPYRMAGRVVRGERLGRELGFPTANVDLRRRQSPVDGIFAVHVHGLAGGPHDAVASVGSRPTFDGSKPLLEVFLFDFDGDIYGEFIQVDFIAYIRPQEKYEDVEALVAQMHADVDNARSILAANAA